MTTEAERLKFIRARVGRLDDDAEWMTGYSGHERAIVDRDGTMLFMPTRHAHDAEFDLAASAPSDMRFLLGLLDRCKAAYVEKARALEAFRRANPLPGETPGANKDYAAEAAMKVTDVKFRVFVRHHPDARPVGGASGDRDPVDIATDRLRAILSITSRRQLNDEPDAAARWLALREDYARFRAMTDAEREAAYPGCNDVMKGMGE